MRETGFASSEDGAYRRLGTLTWQDAQDVTSATVNISAQGRVSIPAPIRRELGSEAGIPLATYVENGRGVSETREHLSCRIQATATAK